MHEVIARIVDGSEFHEFKALYGSTLVCGFAHIWGMPVAILANNGVLFSESAREGRAFHRARLPAPHSAAVPAEHLAASWSAASMRRKASPSTAPSWSPPSPPRSVPKITVLIGGSFGAGNYGMCGRAYSPALPVHLAQRRISVMGGEQAASVLATVHRDADKWTPEQAEAFKAPIREDYEAQGNPWHATARLWDDGIIDPAQTRDVLGLAFAATPERADPRAAAVRRVQDVTVGDRDPIASRAAQASVRPTAARRADCRRLTSTAAKLSWRPIERACSRRLRALSDSAAMLRGVYRRWPGDGDRCSVASGSGLRQHKLDRVSPCASKPGCSASTERISDPAIEVDGDVGDGLGAVRRRASTARSATAASIISIWSATMARGRS